MDNNKKRNIVLTLVVLLAIGFASVSTTLVINGLLAIGENSDDFKIIFSSATIDGIRKDEVISESKTEISYETKVLSLIDEESTLEYEATNTSRNYDADVQIVCNIVDESENIIEGENEYVDMTYTPESMSLLAGETKQGSITAKLKKAVTEPMDINIKCTLTGTPKERDELGEEPSDPNKLGGTLMVVSENDGWTDDAKTKIWNSNFRENIKKIVFENTLTDHSTSSWLTFDISENQDKSVMAYLVPNEVDSTKYTAYINSDGKIVANPNSSLLFGNFYSLSEIENLKYLDTSKVTNMDSMFNVCRSLVSLDLSSFDTSKVTNMSGMFGVSNSLETLNLSSFDTSNVTDMSYMFNGCNALKNVGFSNFNTSNVVEIRSMFYGCNSLTTLDLSSFNTERVTSMETMFTGCNSLTELIISNFNTSNVTNMEGLFNRCSSLTTLDISSFDISKVTNLWVLFNECKDELIVTVKDEATQNKILSLSSDYNSWFHGYCRPAAWTTDNVIIKY